MGCVPLGFACVRFCFERAFCLSSLLCAAVAPKRRLPTSLQCPFRPSCGAPMCPRLMDCGVSSQKGLLLACPPEVSLGDVQILA